MFDKCGEAGFGISGGDGLDDAFVVGPDFAQVGQVGVGVELDGFVGRPVCFEQTGDEGVLEAAEDGEMEAAVLGVGYGDRAAVELRPGLLDEGLQEGDRVILSDMSTWDAVDRVRLE